MNTIIVAGMITIAVITVFVAGLFNVPCYEGTSGTPVQKSCDEVVKTPQYEAPEPDSGFFGTIFGTIGKLIAYAIDMTGWLLGIASTGIGLPQPIFTAIVIIGYGLLIYILIRLFLWGS